MSDTKEKGGIGGFVHAALHGAIMNLIFLLVCCILLAEKLLCVY